MTAQRFTRVAPMIALGSGLDGTNRAYSTPLYYGGASGRGTP